MKMKALGIIQKSNQHDKQLVFPKSKWRYRTNPTNKLKIKNIFRKNRISTQKKPGLTPTPLNCLFGVFLVQNS